LNTLNSKVYCETDNINIISCNLITRPIIYKRELIISSKFFLSLRVIYRDIVSRA